jgi:phosphoglycolate phosphatase-like HAD superfamily hydrolase
MEWAQLNKSFHDEYEARVERAKLTTGARETIDRVVELGWSQSLLSMSMHDHLLEIVASHGIADRFVSIDGLPSATGGLKARHLETHLAKLQREPTTVLLIGDTPDDALAARGVGAGIVLYDGGSHHLDALHALGAPVADTLEEALDLAVQLAESDTLEVRG